MQGQHESAVDAGSTKTGVTNDSGYETLSARMHGFGEQHDCNGTLRAGSAEICGRCNKSTAGENFEKPLSAGTVYNGEDARPKDERLAVAIENHPAIAGGSPDEALDALDELAHDPDDCTIEKCRRCNRIGDDTLRPGYTIAKGGSSSGRKKKSRRGGAAIPPYIMASYPHPDKVKESEVDRAQRLARENEQRMEIRANAPGRKLKGKEKRMHVQGRLEPSKVAELNEMTGQNCVELLDSVHSVMTLAKSGAEAQVVYASIMQLLQPNAGESAAA